ncbi:hypothetical protein AVV36_gp006 [Pectobacterium bacteriophage PM2]|uniref:Uncharacterized protein n=1 Tax=Pectobacterium bacteriophage PM2 TaxID=1429794 RepID=A0A0A0Q0F7_9CAUD|nr:hypothetical protein AVV36_gp006 [Pectobacterium bacteriophage PM2]AHY24968.1 hypothetical protein PM2_006 [Pectobacterium bacteriophage PM2]
MWEYNKIYTAKRLERDDIIDSIDSINSKILKSINDAGYRFVISEMNTSNQVVAIKMVDSGETIDTNVARKKYSLGKNDIFVLYSGEVDFFTRPEPLDISEPLIAPRNTSIVINTTIDSETSRKNLINFLQGICFNED